MYLVRAQTIAAIAPEQALERPRRGEDLFGPTAFGADVAGRATGAVEHYRLVARLPQDPGQIEQA